MADEAGCRRPLLRRVGLVLAPPLLLVVAAAERSGLTSLGARVADAVGRRRRVLGRVAIVLAPLMVIAAVVASKPEPDPEPEPERIVVDHRAPVPVAVELPAVGISAPVGPLGLSDAGELEAPEDFFRAGWWAQGPEPGERGAAVITAHLDSLTGPAVFYTLADASPGDEVLVHRRDGSTATFVIDRLEQYSKDDFPTDQVYGETPEPTLRLITCGGSFDEVTGRYGDNVVAYATHKPT